MKFIRMSIALLSALLMIMMPVVAQESTEEPMEQETPYPEVTEVAQFDSQGYVRFGHFVSDVGAVDIYLDGEVAAENVEFPNLGDWYVLEAGNHSVAVSATGDSIDNAVLETSFDVSQDNWATIGVIGTADDLNITMIDQAMYTELPSTAQLTFANVMHSEDGVDFIRDDVIFVANAPALSTIGDMEIQNSIPTDARTFTFGVLDQTQEVDVVDTSSYLILAVGTPENPQLVIDETPLWEIRLLNGELPAPATLYEALQTEPLASPFLAAVEEAGLVELLSNTNGEALTIFVPVDYVMDDVDMSREDLSEILRYHIVTGNFKAGDLFLQTPTLTTIDGDPLTISQTEQGFVNGAQIIEVNHVASNGTIHIINQVLIPAE